MERKIPEGPSDSLINRLETPAAPRLIFLLSMIIYLHVGSCASQIYDGTQSPLTKK